MAMWADYFGYMTDEDLDEDEEAESGNIVEPGTKISVHYYRDTDSACRQSVRKRFLEAGDFEAATKRKHSLPGKTGETV